MWEVDFGSDSIKVGDYGLDKRATIYHNEPDYNRFSNSVYVEINGRRLSLSVRRPFESSLVVIDNLEGITLSGKVTVKIGYL